MLHARTKVIGYVHAQIAIQATYKVTFNWTGKIDIIAILSLSKFYMVVGVVIIIICINNYLGFYPNGKISAHNSKVDNS